MVYFRLQNVLIHLNTLSIAAYLNHKHLTSDKQSKTTLPRLNGRVALSGSRKAVAF